MAFFVQQDGFSTLIAFSLQSTVHFKEVENQPPGLEAGGANNLTTMRNTRWRTMAPKKLITMAESSLKVQYDPSVLSQIVGMLGLNQQITTTFPDGSTWVWFGWIDSFKPDGNKEGEPPTASVTIIPSNVNGSGAETGPVYTAGPSTTTPTSEAPG